MSKCYTEFRRLVEMTSDICKSAKFLIQTIQLPLFAIICFIRGYFLLICSVGETSVASLRYQERFANKRNYSIKTIQLLLFTDVCFFTCRPFLSISNLKWALIAPFQRNNLSYIRCPMRFAETQIHSFKLIQLSSFTDICFIRGHFLLISNFIQAAVTPLQGNILIENFSSVFIHNFFIWHLM